MTESSAEQFRELYGQLLSLDPYPWSNVQAWIASATPLVRALFPQHFDDFVAVAKTPSWTALPRVISGGGLWDDTPRRDNFAEAGAIEEKANRRRAADARKRIQSFVSTLVGLLRVEAPPTQRTPSEVLQSMLDRFPAATRALRDRGRSRPDLVIEDEYDVQYLLGSLLAVAFDDVRPEEWCPSYAGRASRMDFLLKSERIVVETKFVRKGHIDREIADELIIDKERYRAHADCGTLVCFVYDPERLLRNPVALERDLAEKGPLSVDVLVRPR